MRYRDSRILVGGSSRNPNSSLSRCLQTKLAQNAELQQGYIGLTSETHHRVTSLNVAGFERRMRSINGTAQIHYLSTSSSHHCFQSAVSAGRFYAKLTL